MKIKFFIYILFLGVFPVSQAQQRKNATQIESEQRLAELTSGKPSTLFTRRPMVVERDRPAEWDNLVLGGQFIDLFELMPVQGELRYDTWGGDHVTPRYVDNGIEDPENKWSLGGGAAVLGKDNLWHAFVTRKAENAPGGHASYRDPRVKREFFHAVSENLCGPYRLKEQVPLSGVLMKLIDGRYLIKSRYSALISCDTPVQGIDNSFPAIKGLSDYWKEIPDIIHDNRQRDKNEEKPWSYAQREDGSFLMVTRHGDIWVSETGISSYYKLTDKRVYPQVEGRFEDPALWRTGFQYHLIMNDWQGRVAYHMRSKDGVHWKLDPGLAYGLGIAKYEDGTKVDWYKYEVPRMIQDEYGRPIAASFTAYNCAKIEDLENDNNNQKTIFIPLTPERLLTMMNEEPITLLTKDIRIKIKAEEGFNPHKDIDLSSLRFGASEEVDFGRGCKLKKTKKSGNDLILIFNATGNGFSDENFAGKLLGKTKEGKLLFGYTKLPGVKYIEPLLSTLPPKFTPIEGGVKIEVEVQNFGQVNSVPTPLKVMIGTRNLEVIEGQVPPLEPWERTVVEMKRMETRSVFYKGVTSKVVVQIDPPGQKSEKLVREIEILPLKEE